MLPVSQENFETFLQNLPLPKTPESLYDPIRYILQIGGKRVRPRLVFAGCGLCGGQVSEASHAAAAVETLHNFTLIHDDIMDNADKRRGLPTVHARWNEATAILSGDALFAFSFELLNFYGDNPTISKEQFAALNRIFLHTTRIVCEGQARDMNFESRSDVTLDEYMLMIEQKTAALLKASLEMGAIIANASNEEIERCGNIGLSAGIAFQIQDDLLDAIGDPSKFGKKAGGDIAEGKKTYLSILALQKADDADKSRLNQILQSSSVNDEEIAEVIRLYEKYGILDDAKKAIDNLYKQAKTSLHSFPESVFQDEINTLLNQLMIRDH